jgi:response regulator RpfG family c-di-GMP phosphodiesterase
MTGEEAVAQVRRGSGRSFDPELMEPFCRAVEMMEPLGRAA